MQRGLSVLICAALILLGKVANNIAGPRKAARNIDAIGSPIQYPFPKYVDITGVFCRISGPAAWQASKIVNLVMPVTVPQARRALRSNHRIGRVALSGGKNAKSILGAGLRCERRQGVCAQAVRLVDLARRRRPVRFRNVGFPRQPRIAQHPIPKNCLSDLREPVLPPCRTWFPRQSWCQRQ